MCKPRLSKQSIVEVQLTGDRLRGFRGSLIRSHFNDAFDKKGYHVVAQVIVGMKRKLYLLREKKDIYKLLKKASIEKCLIISDYRLRNFYDNCPDCGEFQEIKETNVCPKCKTRFQSPGWKENKVLV